MSKRNLIKIPRGLLAKLQTFDQDDVVVACAKLVRQEDVARYRGIGLSLEGTELRIPSPQIPPASAGRYSLANLAGFEKLRKDLPMVTKDFVIDSPNWGDWSKGSHEVVHTRIVYQRTFYPPKEVTLSITLLRVQDGSYLLKFAVDQVLNRRTPHFERELLYNLNILQENVGAADVFPSAATLAEYATTIRVDWQILPPGTVDEIVEAMLKGVRQVTPDQEAVIKERVAVMARLKPEAYIAGSDEFLRYFGAKFGDDFVVFENVRYGNAIYLMYESWRELSQRSRIDLLAGDRTTFDRIEHREGWKERLKAAVERYRASKKGR